MSRNNPPAPAVTAAIARVTLTTKTLGQLCLTTFDYLSNVPATSPSLADLTALAVQWDAGLSPKILACLSPQTAEYAISVAELHYGTTPTYVNLYAPGTVGTAGATALPLEMGATLSRNGPLKGQHGRGRITMPGVPNTFVTPATDANILNAAALTAYGNLIAQLILPITAGGIIWTHVISTRPLPPLLLTDRAVAVSEYLIRNTLGTARTRKEGRGI